MGSSHRVLQQVGAIGAVVTVVALASCSDSSKDAAGGRTDRTPTTVESPPVYQPSFATVACGDPRFVDLDIGAGGECGTLTVPEDRSNPTGRQVTLAVLRLPALDGSVGGVPLVYLSGGPGDAAIDAGWQQRVVAADRPVILVDQRGTGRSTPSLDCPEIDEATWRELAEGMDLDARSVSASRARAACRKRLAGEVDLDSYDTPTMAADMADLRTAMGLDEWSILGVSYGTAIGREILRSHPDGLQAAILDSVVEPGLDDGPGAGTKGVEEAFGRLFGACDGGAACATNHPDLEADLLAIRDRLNAAPHEVPFTDSDGVSRVARLTGDTVLGGMFQAMYDSSLIGLLPSFIGQVANGQDGVLDAVGGPLLGTLAEGSNGVFLSVGCADRQDRSTPGNTEQLRKERPLAAFRADDTGCADWDVESVPGAVNTVGATTVPTLLLGGQFDPVTPAEGTKRVARKMGARATFVELPGLGHGVLFAADPCPHSIADAFLAAPDAPVDTSCVAPMPPVTFS